MAHFLRGIGSTGDDSFLPTGTKRLGRESGAHHEGRHIFKDYAFGADHSATPDRDPGAYKYTCGQPCFRPDVHRTVKNVERGKGVIMGSRTDVRVLRDDGVRAYLDLAQGIQRDMIADPAPIADRELPGIDDLDRGTNPHSLADVSPEPA